MAITERYVSSLAGGGGDGSSGSPWTLTEAATNAVEDDRVNVKDDGTYTLTADFTPSNGGSNTGCIVWRGYTSVIGDGGVATIDGGASYQAEMTASGHYFQSIEFTASGSIPTLQVSSGGDNTYLDACRVLNTGTGKAAQFDGSGMQSLSRSFFQCVSERVIDTSRELLMHSCHITRTASSGYALVDFSAVYATACIFACNGYGRAMSGAGGFLSGNVFYDASGDFIDLTYMRVLHLVDNIFWTSGGYALDISANWDYPGLVVMVNNAMGNLTSGRINSAAGDIVERSPITLTQDPFVDAANGDFRPNDAAGGGRLCKFMGLEAPAA